MMPADAKEPHSSGDLLALVVKAKLVTRGLTTMISGVNKKMTSLNEEILVPAPHHLGRCGAVLVLMSSFFCYAQTAMAANPPAITATYIVTAMSSTCDLTMETPTQITLPTVSVTDFSAGPIPSGKGAPIKLRLTACSGTGGQKVPKISIYGDRDQVTTDPNLYRGPTSVATNVGFVLMQGTNGSGQLMEAGSVDTPVKVQVPGTDGATVPNNKTIDFYVQYSRGGNSVSSITTGPLAATIHFDFLYE